jgi:hypothetical protein
MTTTERLRAFATRVLAQAGGVIEWPDHAACGEVLLPPALAQRWECPELASIAQGADADLRLDVAGECLERLQGLVDEGSWQHAGRLADRPPRALDAQAVVDRSVDVANARVRLAQAAMATAEYHRWHLAVHIQGEESWEDVVTIAINAQTSVPVPLRVADAQLIAWHPSSPAPDTRHAAVRASTIEVERRAGPFLARLAGRRERDRKRLRDYYRSLLMGTSRLRRSTASATAAERDHREQAVDLELRRKLAEVDERSRVRIRFQPVALLRLELPVWTLDLTIQRRTATRPVRIYWNQHTCDLEPLPCAGCGSPQRSFLAREADAALLCAACWRSQ